MKTPTPSWTPVLLRSLSTLLVLAVAPPALAASASPPRGVRIVHPTTGARLRDVPLELRVVVSPRVDTSTLEVEVNGQRRARKLEQVSRKVWRLALFPVHLRPGRNKIKLSATMRRRGAGAASNRGQTSATTRPGKAVRAGVGFSYRIGASTGTTPVDTHTLAPYFPVRTRVVAGGGWAISVAAHAPITPPSGSPQAGYQVVVLDGDVTGNDPVNGPDVLDNAVYPGTSAGLASLEATLTDVDYYQQKGCGTPGCIVVIQSLQQMGVTDCPTPAASPVCQTPDRTLPGSIFASLGGTYAASFADGSSGTAYSLVAQVGVSVDQASQKATLVLPAFGTANERLSCLMTVTGCTPGMPDQLAGVVVTDGTGASTRNTFMATGPLGPLPVTVRNISPTTGLNTMIIGPQTATSDPVAGGGFHVVTVDRTVDRSAGAVLSNQTFAEATDMAMMATALDAVDDDTLALLASVGQLSQDLSLDYEAAAQAVSRLGGSYSVFRTLGWTSTSDDYALIGTTLPPTQSGLTTRQAPEASSIITRSIVGANQVPATTLSSLLLPDHRTLYGPTQGAPADNIEYGLQQAALLPAVAWPVDSSDPAYQYVSAQITANSTTDVRATYPSLPGDEAGTESDKLDCGTLTPPANAPYTTAHLQAVCQQVETELMYVERVQDFSFWAQVLLLTSPGGSSAIASDVKDSVEAGVKAGSGKTSLLLSLFDMVTTTASDALGDVTGFEEIGAAAGVLGDVIDFVAHTVSKYSSTSDPLGVLETTFDDLVTDLTDTFNDGADQALTLTGLVVTDWRRLQTAYGALDGVVLNDYAHPATLLQLSAQSQIYEGLLAAEYQVWNFGPISTNQPAVPSDACQVSDCTASHIPSHVWFSRIVEQNSDGSFAYEGLAIVHFARGFPSTLSEPSPEVMSNLFSPLQTGMDGAPDQLGVFPEYFYLSTTFSPGTDFYSMIDCTELYCP